MRTYCARTNAAPARSCSPEVGVGEWVGGHTRPQEKESPPVTSSMGNIRPYGKTAQTAPWSTCTSHRCMVTGKGQFLRSSSWDRRRGCCVGRRNL